MTQMRTQLPHAMINVSSVSKHRSQRNTSGLSSGGRRTAAAAAAAAAWGIPGLGLCSSAAQFIATRTTHIPWASVGALNATNALFGNGVINLDPCVICCRRMSGARGMGRSRSSWGGSNGATAGNGKQAKRCRGNIGDVESYV